MNPRCVRENRERGLKKKNELGGGWRGVQSNEGGACQKAKQLKW